MNQFVIKMIDRFTLAVQYLQINLLIKSNLLLNLGKEQKTQSVIISSPILAAQDQETQVILNILPQILSEQKSSTFYTSQTYQVLPLKMGNQICERVQTQSESFRKTITINTTSQIAQEHHTPTPSSRSNALLIKLQQTQVECYEDQRPFPEESSIKHSKYRYEPKISSSTRLYNSQFRGQQQKAAIKVKYQQFLIHCNQSQVRYTLTSPHPLITGHAKVYSLQNQDQLIYEGELRNSKFDGYGKLYHILPNSQNQHLSSTNSISSKPQVIVYQGEFKNGMFDGWGITEEYIGEWREGVYDGYGIYQQCQSKNTQTVTFYYQGYFQNGLYSGSGVLIKSAQLPKTQIAKIHAKNGIIFYLNEQIQHGMDIIKKYKAKEIYIGQFSNGFRHGFGRLFTQKMEFSGQFSHNLYHGLGTIFNNTNEGKKVIKAVFQMGKQLKQ